MELDQYPATGRFLMGRMRHLMTSQEKGLLETVVRNTEVVASGHPIHCQGADIDHFTMLISGLAVRSVNDDGKRCIIGLQFPGDLMDIHALAVGRLDHDLITIGPATIGYISRDTFHTLLQSQAQLSRLIWFSTLLDAAIQRQWTLKLSKLRASSRLAHLLAEIWTRLELVGLATETGFQTSLTQADLADMCGTTSIHMNRAVRELRTREIADIRRGKVTSDNRGKLAEFGEFDPSYLHIQTDVLPNAIPAANMGHSLSRS